MNTTSKQPMLTSMIEKRIRQGAEPVARADADALEVVILAELAKIGVNCHRTSLYSFIDEVRTHRLDALVEARTAAVADRMVASTEPASADVDAGLSEFLGDAPAAPTIQSVKVEQGDALVVTVSGILSREQADQLRGHIRAELGHNVRILIMDRGASLAVLSGLAVAGDGVTGD